MVEKHHGATIIGANVVHACAAHNDIDILNLILNFLPKCRMIEEVINSRDQEGLTPLMQAACAHFTHGIEGRLIPSDARKAIASWCRQRHG
jgi:hypothetical protein